MHAQVHTKLYKYKYTMVYYHIEMLRGKNIPDAKFGAIYIINLMAREPNN